MFPFLTITSTFHHSARSNWNDHKTDTAWFLDRRIAKLSRVRKTLFGIARTGLTYMMLAIHYGFKKNSTILIEYKRQV